MIGFAGMGHLGIISCVAAAAKGNVVIGYDPNEGLCRSMTEGFIPIIEPGLPELLYEHQRNIRFTHDATLLGGCALVYVALDTETDDHDQSDLYSLNVIIDQVVESISPGTVLIILSQVPPGFTRTLASRLQTEYPDKHLEVFCQVETLVIGQAVDRALSPERVMVGSSDSRPPLPQVLSNYLSQFGCPVMPMAYESAELTKIAINMFLASSVSTTNTLAEVCEVIGADWMEIAPALKLDRRIGPYAYLAPGLGLSGGHLERDLTTVISLAAEYGTDASVVNSWLSNSRRRRDWVLRTLHSTIISQQTDPTIGVWGLSYKENTSSTTNSPSLSLLNSIGDLRVKVYDPEVVLETDSFPGVSQVDNALEACTSADALVIMTPWNEFSTVDLRRVKRTMKGNTIIDPLAVLDIQRCTKLGFRYTRMGSRVKEF